MFAWIKIPLAQCSGWVPPLQKRCWIGLSNPRLLMNYEEFLWLPHPYQKPLIPINWYATDVYLSVIHHGSPIESYRMMVITSSNQTQRWNIHRFMLLKPAFIGEISHGFTITQCFPDAPHVRRWNEEHPHRRIDACATQGSLGFLFLGLGECFEGCSKHVTGIFIGSGNVQKDVSSNWVAGVTLESRVQGGQQGLFCVCGVCGAQQRPVKRWKRSSMSQRVITMAW